MSKQILGYTRNGEPIHPIGAGMLATACLISCSNCPKIIRSMGGPKHGALCTDCFQAQFTVVTKGCGPLFAAFTTAGLNAQVIIRDAAYIVQNDGVELTSSDIDHWAVQQTKKLLQMHQEQLQLITDTSKALKGMV